MWRKEAGGHWICCSPALGCTEHVIKEKTAYPARNSPQMLTHAAFGPNLLPSCATAWLRLCLATLLADTTQFGVLTLRPSSIVPSM